MLNFARFIPGTPEADWLRQQVSERGILEKIDLINEFVNKAFEAEGICNPEEFWQVLDMIEESLRKNMNDPRAKMIIMSYGTIENKENKKEQPKRKVKTIDDPDGTGTPEGTIVGTDPDGGVIGEQGEQGEVPTGELVPAENEIPAEDTTLNEQGIPGEPVNEEDQSKTPEPTTEEPETETPELTEVKEEFEKTEEPTSEEESKEPADETKEEKPTAKRGRKKADTAE